MTTESVERIVVNIVGKRRRVDIAALTEVGVGFPHSFNKCFEESQADTIIAALPLRIFPLLSRTSF